MSMPTAVWSKTYPFKPRPHLQSHVFINKKPFKASFEKDPIPPPSMSLILANEYARMWQQEHCDYITKKRNATKEKGGNLNAKIVNRFNKWVQNYNVNKTKLNQKRYCCSVGVK